MEQEVAKHLVAQSRLIQQLHFEHQLHGQHGLLLDRRQVLRVFWRGREAMNQVLPVLPCQREARVRIAPGGHLLACVRPTGRHARCPRGAAVGPLDTLPT